MWQILCVLIITSCSFGLLGFIQNEMLLTQSLSMNTTSGLLKVKNVVEKSLITHRNTWQFKSAEIYWVDISV